MAKIYTIVSLFDIHYPFHIDLKPVLSFIKEIQPNEIILGGDQIDLFGISKYYKGTPEEGMFEARKEIVDFEKDILIPLNKIAPKAKLIRMDGNHEDRVWEFIAKKEGRDELLNMWKIFAKYCDKFIKYNAYYKTGRLYRTHGMYHNDNHSKKHALAFQKNVVYGHMHEIQTYSSNTLVGEKPHIAKSRPCLANLNPEYKRNMPSGWSNGFGVSYIREDKNFDDYNIIITDGSFIFGGKRYA